MLLKKILDLNVLNDDVFVNIEHSEPSWVNNICDYKKDFSQLKEIVDNYKKTLVTSEKFDAAERYAKSFLKKTLIRCIKNYRELCNSLNTTEDELFDDWLKFVFDRYRKISLSNSEIDSMISKDAVYFLDSFIDFVELQYGR